MDRITITLIASLVFFGAIVILFPSHIIVVVAIAALFMLAFTSLNA